MSEPLENEIEEELRRKNSLKLYGINLVCILLVQYWL